MTIALPGLANAPRFGRAGSRGLLGGLVARLVRLAWVMLGAVLMAAGVLIAPLPGPFGLPVAVVGLMLILRNSYWAKRRFIRMQQARPNWVFPFRRLMRRRPEIAPVFWQQLLRIERLLLKKGHRVLSRLRRRVFVRRPASPVATGS